MVVDQPLPKLSEYNILNRLSKENSMYTELTNTLTFEIKEYGIGKRSIS